MDLKERLIQLKNSLFGKTKTDELSEEDIRFLQGSNILREGDFSKTSSPVANSISEHFNSSKEQVKQLRLERKLKKSKQSR